MQVGRLVDLKLLMFKACGVIGILKIEHFNFYDNEKFNH